jgi:hypothetical protein
MTTFTIDNDNNITAYAAPEQAQDALALGAQLFTRSPSENSPTLRVRRERNRHIMFYAEGLPALFSRSRSAAAAESAGLAA